MSKITAIARIADKESAGDGQTRLSFFAPYSRANGERIAENAEWAKYTPFFQVNMVALDEVAEHFELGVEYLVTFEPRA